MTPRPSVEALLAAHRHDVPLVAPPPLVSQRLRRMMAARSGRVPPLVQVVGEIAIDTRRLGRPVGVRGPRSCASTRYQLTFEAAPATVVVDVAVADDVDGVVLRGQVLPTIETAPVFEATAWGPSGVIRAIRGDELGGFELRGVPHGVVNLVVTNDELEIRMALVLTGGPLDGPA